MFSSSLLNFVEMVALNVLAGPFPTSITLPLVSHVFSSEVMFSWKPLLPVRTHSLSGTDRIGTCSNLPSLTLLMLVFFQIMKVVNLLPLSLKTLSMVSSLPVMELDGAWVHNSWELLAE